MRDELNSKISKDSETGLKSEEFFIELMTNKGCRCYKATKDENMREHWDVLVVKEVNDVSVFKRIDIKSNKDSHSQGFTWVELQNVRGDIGWLYSEYMDVIAFEKDNCFELVNRIELALLVEENIKKADVEDGEEINYCSKDNLKPYRRYRRVGREDRVVKVPFTDIEHLIYKRVYK